MLILVDGTDGSGKTTAIKEYVAAHGGVNVERSPLAQQLVSRITDPDVPLQEQLGFGIAYTLEMVRLSRQYPLALIDRSCISTYAYQCYHDGAKYAPLVDMLRYVDFGPVVSLLFTCDYDTSARRIAQRGAHSKFGNSSTSSYKLLQEGLVCGQNLIHAHTGSHNYFIDANGSIEQSVKQMYDAITRHT